MMWPSITCVRTLGFTTALGVFDSPSPRLSDVFVRLSPPFLSLSLVSFNLLFIFVGNIGILFDVPLTCDTGMLDESVGGRLRILFLFTKFADENAPLVGAEAIGGGGRGFIGCNTGGCE